MLQDLVTAPNEKDYRRLMSHPKREYSGECSADTKTWFQHRWADVKNLLIKPCFRSIDFFKYFSRKEWRNDETLAKNLISYSKEGLSMKEQKLVSKLAKELGERRVSRDVKEKLHSLEFSLVNDVRNRVSMGLGADHDPISTLGMRRIIQEARGIRDSNPDFDN